VENELVKRLVYSGLLAATGMQTAFGECMYPVLGSVKWIQNYFAAAAGPLVVAAAAGRGHA